MKGLCEACRHQRLIRNTRGSVFSMCELSRVDPAYPKYPPMPVLECRGFEARGGAREVSSAEPRSRPPS